MRFKCILPLYSHRMSVGAFLKRHIPGVYIMGCRESIFTQPRKTDIRKQIQTERCRGVLTFGDSTLGVGVRCHGVRGPRSGSGTVCTIGISCGSFTLLGCLALSQF